MGWVRGNIDTNEELLVQINELRKQNEAYREKISKNISRNELNTDKLSQGKDTIEVRGEIRRSSDGFKNDWSVECSWDEIFNIIGPELFEYKNESIVKTTLAKGLNKIHGYVYYIDIFLEHYNTIKIQFMALGYVEVKPLNTVQGSVDLFWGLTNSGKKYLMNLRAVRKT